MATHLASPAVSSLPSNALSSLVALKMFFSLFFQQFILVCPNDFLLVLLVWGLLSPFTKADIPASISTNQNLSKPAVPLFSPRTLQ